MYRNNLLLPPASLPPLPSPPPPPSPRKKKKKRKKEEEKNEKEDVRIHIIGGCLSGCLSRADVHGADVYYLDRECVGMQTGTAT